MVELERLATALWVTRELGEGTDVDARAARLHEVKPHVTVPVAADAVREIDGMLIAAAATSA